MQRNFESLWLPTYIQFYFATMLLLCCMLASIISIKLQPKRRSIIITTSHGWAREGGYTDDLKLKCVQMFCELKRVGTLTYSCQIGAHSLGSSFVNESSPSLIFIEWTLLFSERSLILQEFEGNAKYSTFVKNFATTRWANSRFSRHDVLDRARRALEGR
jgi:hypothetical protein